MSDYFDRLELELRAAVPRAAATSAPAPAPIAPAPAPAPARRWRAPRVRLTLGGLSLGLAVTVSVAVAVLAITLLGHARRAPVRSTTAPPAALAYGELTLPDLRAHFAVLRHAATAADTPPAPLLASMRSAIPGEDPTTAVVPGAPRLIRLARTLPDGTRVYLAAMPVRSRRHAFDGGYELWLWVLDRGGGSTGQAFGPRDYIVNPLAEQAASGFTQLVGLIPDGVQRIQWTFCAAEASGCAARGRSSSVQRAVSGNIAAATAPAGCAHVAGQCMLQVAWYGAGGRVVARFGQDVFQDLPAPPFIGADSATGPVLATPMSARAAAVLQGDGIAGYRFGAAASAIVPGLQLWTGLSSGAYQQGQGCGVQAQIVFTPHYLGSLVASRLSLFIRGGRFVGYQYGTEAPAAVDRRQPDRLTTAARLGIGDTLTRGQRLYGSSFRLSSAQGGSWSVRTASGVLDGFASGATSRARVLSIDAGDVGCPALSP